MMHLVRVGRMDFAIPGPRFARRFTVIRSALTTSGGRLREVT